MIVVSMHEFIANQNKYLGLVKSGEEIVLKSKGNGSFALTPISEYTTLIPKEYVLEPDNDLERAITGKELLDSVIPRVEKLFDK